MLILIIITYSFNLLDLYFTVKLVDKFGLDVEANPIGKLLLMDKKVAALVKIFVVGLSLAVLYIMRGVLIVKISIWLLFAIFTILTLYHIIIILYLKIKKLWV